MGLTEQGAEVVAAVAALQSERDTLRALLDEVMGHVQLVNRMDESIAVLPADLVARITEAAR